MRYGTVPVLVQAVEELGVEGISGSHPLLVRLLLNLGGKVGGILAVVVDKCRNSLVAAIWINLFEKATPNDLEGLRGLDRLPRRFDAPHSFLDTS